MNDTNETVAVFLDKACWAHANWKKRLRRFSDGGEMIEPGIAARDDQCDLGRWIHGEGGVYCNLPEYAHALQEHKHFHQHAGDLASAISVGNLEYARQQLENDQSAYNKASQCTIDSLLALRAAIGQRNEAERNAE